MSMSSWSASSSVHDMHMDVEFESVSSLERDFCSNFTCCGEVHGDLHALIAHHEAAPAHAHPHVRLRLRLAAAPQQPAAPVAQPQPQPQPHNDVATTAPPSPTSSSSSSLSSSSSCCSSQPESPITPFDSPLHNNHEPNPKDTSHVFPDDLLPELEYPTYEHCYHAAIAGEITSTSALFSRPDASDVNPFALAPEQELEHAEAQAQCQSESPYTTLPLSPLPGSPAAFVLSSCFGGAPSVSSESSSCAGSPAPSRSPSPSPSSPALVVKPRTGTKRKAEGEHGVYGGTGAGRDVIRGVPQYTGPVLGQGTSAGGSGGVKRKDRAKTKERSSASGRARVKGREKSYACPTPGCTKSYLNPNGLKYHLDKGTCVLEEEVVAKGEAVDVYPVVKEPVDVLPASSENTSDSSMHVEAAPEVAPAPAPISALQALGLQYPSPPAPHATPIPAAAPMPVQSQPQSQVSHTAVPNLVVPVLYQPQPMLARQHSASLLQAAKHQQQTYRSRPQPQPRVQTQKQAPSQYRALYLPQAPPTQAQTQVQMQRGYR